MDQPTLEFLLADLALAAIFCGLLAFAERNPRNYWRFLALGVRPGLTTLADMRTSSALFFSGLRSIAWGFILIAFLLLTALVIFKFDDLRHPHILSKIFFGTTGLITGMCFVAGVEHLVRSFLRRNKPAPPPK